MDPNPNITTYSLKEGDYDIDQSIKNYQRFGYFEGFFIPKENYNNNQRLMVQILNTDDLIIYRGGRNFTFEYIQDQIKRQNLVFKMLNHQNIIKLRRYFQHENNHFFCLENCDQDLLSFLNENQGNITEEQIVKIIKQVCQGFHYMYKQGICHQDITPCRIFLQNNNVKIAWQIGDFLCGEKYYYDNLQKQAILFEPKRNQLQFLCPETLSNKKGFDRFKADVYSTGILLYNMLFDCFPWSGNDQAQLCYQIQNKKLQFHENYRQISNKYLFDLMSNMLVPDEKNRFDWDQVIAELCFSKKFMYDESEQNTPGRQNQRSQISNSITQLSESKQFFIAKEIAYLIDQLNNNSIALVVEIKEIKILGWQDPQNQQNILARQSWKANLTGNRIASFLEKQCVAKSLQFEYNNPREKKDITYLVNQLILHTKAIYQWNLNILNIKAVCFNLNKDQTIFEAITLTEEQRQGNLLNFIKTNKVLILNEKFQINLCMQIAEGIKYLHSYGIVHYSLKPQNVLLDEKRIVKLCDFELSKVYYSLSQQKKLIQQVIDNPRYSSYEYLNRYNNQQELDNNLASDIWNLGCLFYLIFTQQEPWAELNATVTMAKIICKLNFLEFHQQQLIKLPQYLYNLLDKCLKHKFQERVQIDQLIKELQYINNLY